MKRAPAILFPFAAAAVAVACSSKPAPVAPLPTATDAGAANDGGMTGTAPPPPDGGLVAPPPSASTATMPTFFTDGGAPPGPAMTEQAMDVALDALVTAAAPKNAPKMADEGNALHNTLAKEGDRDSMMVTLQPGRCYTFIGASLPGQVAQLDVNVYGPPYTVPAYKSDPKDKALPMVAKGAQATCPFLPLAIAYKVEVVATKGAGRATVHVFSRAK